VKREVPTYFGELEENQLVIERCKTVLTIRTREAEGADEDPGRGMGQVSVVMVR